MTASPQQLHEMLTYCINFSRTMLERTGDFYPFGATLSPQGVVAAVGGYDGEERPKPIDIYKLLGSAFSAGAKKHEYLGVALAANVNIPPMYTPKFPDGLRVHMESPGYARFIYVPYSVSPQGLNTKQWAVELGEMFAVKIDPVFYTAPAEA